MHLLKIGLYNKSYYYGKYTYLNLHIYFKYLNKNDVENPLGYSHYKLFRRSSQIVNNVKECLKKCNQFFLTKYSLFNFILANISRPMVSSSGQHTVNIRNDTFSIMYKSFRGSSKIILFKTQYEMESVINLIRKKYIILDK